MSVQKRVQQLLSGSECVTESTGVKKNKFPLTIALATVVMIGGSFVSGAMMNEAIHKKKTPQTIESLQMAVIQDTDQQVVDQVIVRKQDDYLFTSKQISQALPFKSEISALFNATLESNVENIFLARLEITKSIHNKIVEIDETLDNPTTDSTYNNLSRYRVALVSLDAQLLTLQSSEQVMDMLPTLKQMAANEIHWDIDKKMVSEVWIDPDTGKPFPPNTKHNLSVDLDEPPTRPSTPKL